MGGRGRGGQGRDGGLQGDGFLVQVAVGAQYYAVSGVVEQSRRVIARRADARVLRVNFFFLVTDVTQHPRLFVRNPVSQRNKSYFGKRSHSWCVTLVW